MEKENSLKLTKTKCVKQKKGFKYLDFLISSGKSYLLLTYCCGIIALSFEKEKLSLILGIAICLFLHNYKIILNEK